MKLRTLSAAVVPLAGLFLAACTSSDNKIANGLVAGVLLDTTDVDDGGTVGTSAKTHFTSTANEAGTEVTARWDSGPFSDKDRVFTGNGVPTNGILTYELDNEEEEGIFFAGGTPDAAFAVGGVHTKGTTDAVVGLSHFGTDPSSVPTTGTLAYSGGTAGFLVDTGNPDPFSGHAAVNANFGTGAVSGTFSNLEADDFGVMQDITFTGSMSNGNANYEANTVAYGGSAATGTLLGGFYGAGAVDTSGVFDITTPGGSPIRAMGGYAATSVP